MTKKKKVVCGDCGADMVLRNSKFGKFYGCVNYPKCKGAHGAHPNGHPLGTPADKETRDKRMEAHALFDKQWRESNNMTRAQAYKELQKIMGMNSKQAHIAKFTKEECDFLISYLGGIK